MPRRRRKLIRKPQCDTAAFLWQNGFPCADTGCGTIPQKQHIPLNIIRKSSEDGDSNPHETSYGAQPWKQSVERQPSRNRAQGVPPGAGRGTHPHKKGAEGAPPEAIQRGTQGTVPNARCGTSVPPKGCRGAAQKAGCGAVAPQSGVRGRSPRTSPPPPWGKGQGGGGTSCGQLSSYQIHKNKPPNLSKFTKFSEIFSYILTKHRKHSIIRNGSYACLRM